MPSDVRWIQRLDNYERALANLTAAVELSRTRPLSNLEQQGMIQAFEFTFELAWNVMKDFLTSQGVVGMTGSKDAARQAFNKGLITEGQVWMDMIDSRNEASHTYHDEVKDKLVTRIVEAYHTEMANFWAAMRARAQSAHG
jgi:nucleotidyltransferase substrate binding protein (TIGR01987 family)